MRDLLAHSAIFSEDRVYRYTLCRQGFWTPKEVANG